MNLSRLLITILVSIMVCSSAWGQGGHIERLILEDRDAYEISFGPYVECFIGQHNLIVPIWLTNEEPVDYIHLILEFDPSLVEMLVIAPTLFYQHFRYGFLTDGRVEIELERNLSPPPLIPPIPAGDTVIAHILMDVVADDPGMDISSTITFYEDINTPFPDNLLMLESGWFIIPPQLALTDGDIYIYSPVYGDINLNSLPFEIGDVITFVSYLAGQMQFSARQMANSDCNRDGIQATVSDLVYLLNVINDEPDTLLVYPPEYPGPEDIRQALEIFDRKSIKMLDNHLVYSIFINKDEPLGGFTFTLDAPDCVSLIGDVALGQDVSVLQLASNEIAGIIKIVGYSINREELPDGSIELIRIPFETSCSIDADDFKILSADFSSDDGRKTEFEYQAVITNPNNDEYEKADRKLSSIEVPKVYPNPFNANATISFSTTQHGPVLVEIYNILGRKVTTLRNGFEQAGAKNVTWNGKNSSGETVAAGIYLCRIKVDGEERVVKLQYLK